MKDFNRYHRTEIIYCRIFKEEHEERRFLTSDPRGNASPVHVTSQSVIAPGVKETQTHNKMAATLLKEVHTSKLIDVPNLIEDKFSDEAISKGMGNAKYPNFPQLAESFTVKVSDIVKRFMFRPAKLGNFVSRRRRTNKKASSEELDGSGPSSTMESDGKAEQQLSDEEQLACYMNDIGETVRLEYGIDGSTEESRVFSARFRDRAPADAPVDCIRKPDGVLLKRKKLHSVDTAWSDIKALVEFKSAESGLALKDAYTWLCMGKLLNLE